MALQHGVLGTLIGLGLAKTAPELLPELGTTLRPAAKTLIHKGLVLIDAAQELVAEGREHLSELIAEVEYERSLEKGDEKEEKAKAA